MELMLEGSNSIIVRAWHASEMTSETVSFLHECAILSQDAWRSRCLSVDSPCLLLGIRSCEQLPIEQRGCN